MTMKLQIVKHQAVLLSINYTTKYIAAISLEISLENEYFGEYEGNIHQE